MRAVRLRKFRAITATLLLARRVLFPGSYRSGAEMSSASFAERVRGLPLAVSLVGMLCACQGAAGPASDSRSDAVTFQNANPYNGWSIAANLGANYGATANVVPDPESCSPDGRYADLVSSPQNIPNLTGISNDYNREEPSNYQY